MFDLVTSTATLVNPEVNAAVGGLFTTAFHGLLLVFVAGLTYGVKLGLGSIKNSIVRAFAQRAVAFAENRLTGDEEKRKYVAAQIHAKFPRISEDDANHYLEEAVTKLHTDLTA